MKILRIHLGRLPCSHVLMYLCAAMVICARAVFAEHPQWWIDRGVLNTNDVIVNDYAAVNQGQLKNMAVQAYAEFQEKMPSQDLSAISNLILGFSSTNNYMAVNIGQLKYVVHSFYDVMWDNNLTNGWPEGMLSGPYPWSSATGDANDFGLANLGQLKYVFSFELSDIYLDPDADQDGDGLSYATEILLGTDPYDADSDGDSLPDGYEIFAGLDPLDPSDAISSVLDEYEAASLLDPDGDGAPDWYESLMETNPDDFFD